MTAACVGETAPAVRTARGFQMDLRTEIAVGPATLMLIRTARKTGQPLNLTLQELRPVPAAPYPRRLFTLFACMSGW